MITDSRRLAGIAYVTVDGQSYMLQGELTYRVSSVERETLIGQDAVHGYSEKPAAGFISCVFRDSADVSLADINDMINVSVTCELANGKTIIGRNMWSTGVQEVKTAEATFEVRFESESVEEA